MALVAEAVIFVGFSPTYYLKFRYPVSRPLSPLVHIHALVFTLWMIYFVAQTALISIKRPALHRKLGIVGAFLGSAVIGMGLLVAVVAMRLGHGSPTQDAEVIFLVSLVDIGSFGLFFLLGYFRRRDTEAHHVCCDRRVDRCRNRAPAPVRRFDTSAWLNQPCALDRWPDLRPGNPPEHPPGLSLGRSLRCPYIHSLPLCDRRHTLVAPCGSSRHGKLSESFVSMSSRMPIHAQPHRA